MPPYRITALSEVDAALHGEYKADGDNGFVLNLTGDLSTLPDIARLKTSLDRERELKEQEEKARKTAEQNARDARDALATNRGALTETELKRLRDEAEAERKPLVEENTKLKATVKQLTVTDKVKALALAADADPTSVDLVLKDTEGRFDTTADGDSLVVLDEKGQATALKPEEFFEKHREQRPALYLGTKSSGGGAPRRTPGNDKAPKQTDEEKKAAKREQGGYAGAI